MSKWPTIWGLLLFLPSGNLNQGEQCKETSGLIPAWLRGQGAEMEGLGLGGLRGWRGEGGGA